MWRTGIETGNYEKEVIFHQASRATASSIKNTTMRAILSLGLTALVASTPSSVSAETTIAVLEFGPGGAVHRTTSSVTESNSAAVTSFWDVLHRPTSSSSKYNSMSSQHAGMSVVPDLFKKADAGIIVGLQAESLQAMPTAASLLDVSSSASVDNVVGYVHVPGQVGAELLKRANASSNKDALENIDKDDMERRLQSTAEIATLGELEGGMTTLSLNVGNDVEAATVADEHLGRMLKTLREQAAEKGKTVIVHVVIEDGARRRLEDGQQNEENQNQNNNNYNSNQKSMYEIQSFNLYLWTTVGLIVIVFMVLSAFISMPLMPDTLLFGEAAKIGGD